MEATWNPLFAFAVFAIIFGVGDFIANKTKGLVSTIVVGCLVYLVGFWTNIIPKDGLDVTTMPALMSAFGIALLITNLGTMIDLENFIKEWKTVAIAVFGLVGLAVGSFTIGIKLFGRVYSLAAAAPISGGIIAGIIVDNAAKAVNQPNIGGFAMLLVGFQMFIGMPLSSFLLKKEANRLMKDSNFVSKTAADKAVTRKINFKFIPDFPKSMQSSTILIARVAAVAAFAAFIAKKTLIAGSMPPNYYLNPNIAYLIFGIIFTEIGFLEKNSLTKAGASGLLMLGVIAILPGSLKALTPQEFLKMLYPLVGTLVLGAIFICAFSAILGKILGYSIEMSMAIGLTALVAFPGTQIITDEVVGNLTCSEEERKAVYDYILPKMLIGGFATVTIASVVFAGILAPLIFK